MTFQTLYALRLNNDVMGVPALRLFVQGEVKAERAGAAGKADIEAWIDENLK